jgi:catechol 2,3-dioxygenase-like lactoylglutathione lyase family enzyme
MVNPENVSPGAPGSRPSLAHGVLETALYVDDLAAADRFYSEVLGLPKIFSVPGRQLVYRSQESVLLIFLPQHTERERVVINGGAIPLHGAHGAGHMAFRVPKRELEPWRQYFRRVGVAIESEVSWPNGAHSIYFRDPAGNSLELATPDMWMNLSSEM